MPYCHVMCSLVWSHKGIIFMIYSNNKFLLYVCDGNTQVSTRTKILTLPKLLKPNSLNFCFLFGHIFNSIYKAK